MTKRTLAAVCVLLVLFAVGGAETAARPTTLSDNPWSVGVGLGFVTVDEFALFAFEIPVQYTFKAGPGELVASFAMLLGARSGFVTIALPMGVRYKIRVVQSHPIYVWPFLDIGPSFVAKPSSGGVGGYLRAGGGVSYLVHPRVELYFQPLGIGAAFNSDGGVFSYNLMLGSNFRF